MSFILTLLSVINNDCRQLQIDAIIHPSTIGGQHYEHCRARGRFHSPVAVWILTSFNVLCLVLNSRFDWKLTFGCFFLNYTQAWVNDHLRIATTCLQQPLFRGPIFNFYNIKKPLNNDHLSIPATIFGSRGWFLHTGLIYTQIEG